MAHDCSSVGSELPGFADAPVNLLQELILWRLPCNYTNFFTISGDKKVSRLETTYA